MKNGFIYCLFNYRVCHLDMNSFWTEQVILGESEQCDPQIGARTFDHAAPIRKEKTN